MLLNLVHGSDRKLLVFRCEPKLTYTDGIINLWFYEYLFVSFVCRSHHKNVALATYYSAMLKVARKTAIVVNTRSRSIGELKA